MTESEFYDAQVLRCLECQSGVLIFEPQLSALFTYAAGNTIEAVVIGCSHPKTDCPLTLYRPSRLDRPEFCPQHRKRQPGVLIQVMSLTENGLVPLKNS